MLNEGLEFREYTEFDKISPIYDAKNDTCSFGRLTMDYLKGGGLHRPLLILARGYLWHDFNDTSLPEIDLEKLSQEELNDRISKVIEKLEDYVYLNPQDIEGYLFDDNQKEALERYKKHLSEHKRIPDRSGVLIRAFLDALCLPSERLKKTVIYCAIEIADLALPRRNGFGFLVSELSRRKPFVNAKEERLTPVKTKELFSYARFSFDSIIAEALWLGPLKNFVAWIPFSNLEKLKEKRYLEAAQPKASVRKGRFLTNVYFLAYLKAMQGVYKQKFVPINWGDLSCYFHSKAIANGVSDKNMIRCLEKPQNHEILIVKSVDGGPMLAGINEKEDVLSLLEVRPCPISETRLPAGEGVYLEDAYAKEGGLANRINQIESLIWANK